MTISNTIRVLAFSGSLRKDSYNTMLLNAITKIVPDEIEVVIFNSMAQIPLFNPDNDDESVAIVNEFRSEIKKSDGLLIASPEYAHGISGVLKNTLDWLVSGDEFPYIPVALCNTSPRATHAQIALREVLSTMSANIIEQASIGVALLGTDYNVMDLIKNKEIVELINTNMAIFKSAIIKSDRYLYGK